MTSEKNAEFGRRVKKFMLDKGMTQSDLARASDLDRNRISSYVRGLSFPTATKAKKLAEGLGIPLEQLLPDEMPERPAHSFSVVRSEDATKMRLICDVWLPLGIGNQVVKLLAEHSMPT